MLICTVCMTRHHLGHKVVDVSENRTEKLLDNLASSIQSLSFKKYQITTVQEKNEQCLKKLKEEKRTILNLVRDKYDSMIQEAENQKEKSRSKITSLEENLDLLNNIKQYISSETLSPTEIKNCQETVDSVTEHNDKAPLELWYMEYTENKEKQRLVQELCGELSRKCQSIKLPYKQNMSGSFRNLNINLPDKQSEHTGNMFGTLAKQSSAIGNLLVKPLPMARRSREMQPTEVLNSLPNQRLLPRFQCKLH